MDGNRTHPGRLSSAPQTVLKTAFLTSADVWRCPVPMSQRMAVIYERTHGCQGPSRFEGRRRSSRRHADAVRKDRVIYSDLESMV